MAAIVPMIVSMVISGFHDAALQRLSTRIALMSGGGEEGWKKLHQQTLETRAKEEVRN